MILIHKKHKFWTLPGENSYLKNINMNQTSSKIAEGKFKQKNLKTAPNAHQKSPATLT